MFYGDCYVVRGFGVGMYACFLCLCVCRLVWVLVGFFVVWRLLLRCRLVLLKLIYDFWCGDALQYLCVNSVVFIVSLVFV